MKILEYDHEHRGKKALSSIFVRFVFTLSSSVKIHVNIFSVFMNILHSNLKTHLFSSFLILIFILFSYSLYSYMYLKMEKKKSIVYCQSNAFFFSKGDLSVRIYVLHFFTDANMLIFSQYLYIFKFNMFLPLCLGT